MDTTGVTQLIFIFLLVGLSTFFSFAESAFTRTSRSRMKALSENGSKRAAAVLKVLDNCDKMTAAILIGNTITCLTAASLLTSFAINVFNSHAIGAAIAVLILLLLLPGKIIPLNIAIIHPDNISMLCSGLILLLMYLFTPFIYAIDKISFGIFLLFHADPRKKDVPMTESELKTYVDASHEDGVIESEEREIIYNIFDFSETMAKDVMIPRIDVVSVSLDMKYDEVLAVFKEYMYTRLPVYEEHKDNIIGLINIKDFIHLTDKESFHIKNILREAYYTYEYKKTADLMMEMRASAANAAFVLNEYGAAVGMITLEDLLEEIVGEIRDEYDDDEEELIKRVDDNTYLVEGGMKLYDINDELDTNLESEDYDSIGGLIIESLDRLPDDEETIIIDSGITLQVKGIGQNRIKKVLMTLPEKPLQTEIPEKENAASVKASSLSEESEPEDHEKQENSPVISHSDTSKHSGE